MYELSEEQVKCFHQDTDIMVKRNQGQWDKVRLGDYVRDLVPREESSHKP